MRNIKSNPATKNGKTWHRVIVPASPDNPKPKHRWFRSKQQADSFARSLNEDRGVRIRELHALDGRGKMLLAEALTKAGSAELVFECVMLHAEKLKLERRPVEEVARECLASKLQSGCRASYLTPFELMLDRFVKFVGPSKAMHQITRIDLQSFVSSPKVKVVGKNRVPDGLPTPWTRRARTIDLRTLFSFALSRGYVRENLAEKLDPIHIDHKAPEILRPAQAKALLFDVHAQQPHLIPYVALCLFGGLRPLEAQRLTWSDIQGDFIDLSASVTKTRRRRLVTLNSTLRAWLRLGGDLPLTEPRARKVRDLIEHWPKNGLRHSFVSYHYALYGGKDTAREAGHSEDILHAHYRELVTKAAAEEFWKLTPDVVLVNVIALSIRKAA